MRQLGLTCRFVKLSGQMLLSICLKSVCECILVSRFFPSFLTRKKLVFRYVALAHVNTRISRNYRTGLCTLGKLKERAKDKAYF